VLQPTRIVARKGIEHSIELIRQLGNPRLKLVLTHASGDEGDAYAARVRRYADIMGVDLIFASSSIATDRARGENGEQLFTIADAYQSADLVTYPSSYEGFGNAFLESIYYKRPILCNRYAIYRTDIEPCGFNVILMEGYLTDDVVERVRQVLTDRDCVDRMVEENYRIARQFFSYRRVETELQALLTKPNLVSPAGPQANSFSGPIVPPPDRVAERPRVKDGAGSAG